MVAEGLDPGANLVRCLYCGRESRGGTCVGCGAEAPSVPCAACGRSVAAPLERCECGAPCTAWSLSPAHDLACPRCNGPLHRVALDGASVHVEQCAHCLGCFARTLDFSELVRREEAGLAVDLRAFVPLAPGRELPRQVLLDPVPCPHCLREMDRVRFAHRASMVVDVCLAAHGIWLDAGELVGIVNFLKKRKEGKVTPDAAEIEDERRWERIRAVHAEEARVVDAHVARMEEQSQVGAGSIALATAVAGPWAGLFVALRGIGRRR